MFTVAQIGVARLQRVCIFNISGSRFRDAAIVPNTAGVTSDGSSGDVGQKRLHPFG